MARIGMQMLASKLYRNGKEDCMPTEELSKLETTRVQEETDTLRAENDLLEEEFECFRRYYKRQDQHLAAGREMGTDYGDDYVASYGLEQFMDTSPSTGAAQKSRHKGHPKGRRQSSSLKDATLSLDDKQHIVNSEVDCFKKDREKEEKEMERSLEMIRACMEEAEVRIAETRKDSFDFNREIGEAQVVAEKLLRYYDEKLKEKERHTAKLRGKHAALKTQIHKHEHQLKQREDMGEVLAPIDFDQLKIENQQFLERIEQKNKELVKLKLTTGNTVQTMNTLTERLNKYTQEQTVLKKDIAHKQNHLETLQKSIQQVVQEREGAERKNASLRLQHEAVKVPKVEDYIQQKAE
eukprot:gene18242-28110_t